jgi:hypothetical protein
MLKKNPLQCTLPTFSTCFYFTNTSAYHSKVINCIYTGGFEIRQLLFEWISLFLTHTHAHTHTHTHARTHHKLHISSRCYRNHRLVGLGVSSIVQQMKRNTEALLGKLQHDIQVHVAIQ